MGCHSCSPEDTKGCHRPPTATKHTILSTLDPPWTLISQNCDILGMHFHWCTVQFCTALYYNMSHTVLYCIVLYHIVHYYSTLQCTVLYCIAQYITLYTVLYCIVQYVTPCTVLYCIAQYITHCAVLYCIAQYSTACCTVLPGTPPYGYYGLGAVLLYTY